jgi:hypothetical protein
MFEGIAASHVTDGFDEQTTEPEAKAQSDIFLHQEESGGAFFNTATQHKKLWQA